MGREVLLHFLEIGVVNVGADDTKLEKLREAASDLSGIVRKTPSKTASFTMVAADTDVPATDPTVVEAMAVLRQHWVTIANTFQSTPVAIVRAVLLDALVRAAREDDTIAAAFVNTARNILPYAAATNEEAVWSSVVYELEEKVDLRAEAEWATPETISIAALNYKAPAALTVPKKPVTIDRNAFKDSILRSTGPHGGDHNPHWPNSPQAWAAEFAARASAAIAKTIEDAVGQGAGEAIDLSAPLTTLAKAISSHVEIALAAFGGATAGLQRRANLLWWKEALYSPSAHVSYRNMPAFTAATLMALDLFEQVPTFSPASVSAFLDEAILLLPEVAQAGKQSFLELLLEAKELKELEPLREAAAQLVPVSNGRGPLLAVIGHPRAGTLDGAALRTLGGISEDVRITPAEWGTFLFREMQAARAIGSTNPKRSRRKA